MIPHTPQPGFSLVEALIAIAVLLIAIVGPLTIVSRSLEGALFAKEQVTATYLAQEGLELAFKIREDAALAAVASGNAWAWTSGSPYDVCFESDGCGLTIETIDTPIDCSSDDDCALFLADSGQARYQYSDTNAVETPYHRVITFSNVSGVNAVRVESTVTWSTGLTGGSEEALTASSYMYDVR